MKNIKGFIRYETLSTGMVYTHRLDNKILRDGQLVRRGEYGVGNKVARFTIPPQTVMDITCTTTPPDHTASVDANINFRINDYKNTDFGFPALMFSLGVGFREEDRGIVTAVGRTLREKATPKTNQHPDPENRRDFSGPATSEYFYDERYKVGLRYKGRRRTKRPLNYPGKTYDTVYGYEYSFEIVNVGNQEIILVPEYIVPNDASGTDVWTDGKWRNDKTDEQIGFRRIHSMLNSRYIINEMIDYEVWYQRRVHGVIGGYHLGLHTARSPEGKLNITPVSTTKLLLCRGANGDVNKLTEPTGGLILDFVSRDLEDGKEFETARVVWGRAAMVGDNAGKVYPFTTELGTLRNKVEKFKAVAGTPDALTDLVAGDTGTVLAHRDGKKTGELTVTVLPFDLKWDDYKDLGIWRDIEHMKQECRIIKIDLILHTSVSIKISSNVANSPENYEAPEDERHGVVQGYKLTTDNTPGRAIHGKNGLHSTLNAHHFSTNVCDSFVMLIP